MVRVLHLIPGLTGGGAERQLTMLAATQALRGHEIHIGVSRPELPDLLIGNASVHVHQLPTNGNHNPLLFVAIRRLIKSTGADIVQTWLTMMDVVGGAAALSARRAWILSERSEAAMYPANWKNRLRAQLGKSANAIVANSESGVDYWSHVGAARNRVVMVPNAVNVAEITGSKQTVLPVECAGRPVVLFVGRLTVEKMPFVMIDALAKVIASSNAVALLCGSGPLEDDMRAAVRRHAAADRIIFAGHRHDVFGLMREASVCVAISCIEGTSNVMLEAMAAGCPLVVSDIPGYRQLLDNTNAIIVPLNDVDATTSAILMTLNDPTAAKRRALQAKACVLELSSGNTAAQLDVVYARVLGRESMQG
ncbi:MAG: glycosyltransferase [Gemmatimonadota bacterium]|nr:glycosyltransferase [Gemmatimonadota bacterium]